MLSSVIILSDFLYTHTALLKRLFCCSFTFVLVETSKYFTNFDKLGIAVIVKLILFLAASFV